VEKAMQQLQNQLAYYEQKALDIQEQINEATPKSDFEFKDLWNRPTPSI
jgi:hypothetical protein